MNFAEWMLICGIGRRGKSVLAVPYYPSACWEKLLVTELAFQFNDTRLNFRCHDMIFSDSLGAVSIRKTVLPGMAIPMLKIRRPNGRLIFNMEITVRR